MLSLTLSRKKRLCSKCTSFWWKKIYMLWGLRADLGYCCFWFRIYSIWTLFQKYMETIKHMVSDTRTHEHTHSHTHTRTRTQTHILICVYIYIYRYIKFLYIYTNISCPHNNIQYICIYIYKLVDPSRGWLQGPFSIATTRRCNRGLYSFPFIVPFTLDPLYIL